jgi:Secretion system C-terminal sorting domain
MKKLVQILFFILPIFGFSQTDTITRLYTFGGVNNDVAEEAKSTSDGGYIVVGSTSSNSVGNTDVYLLKVDSLCNYEWSKAIGSSNNDWGYSIKQTYDKGYIIAASSNGYGNGGYDAVLMKRDSLGNYQWTKSYGGVDWDLAYSVIQTYDSGYVFCGETYNNTAGLSDVYVVKTNQFGDTIWTKTIGGPLADKANVVIETSDSNIVVAGEKTTLNDSTQVYLMKFTSNGILIWDSIYGDSLYENVNGLIETANTDLVVNGSSTSFSPSGDKDYYLLRTNKDGVLVWAFNYGVPSIPKDDEAFDLREDSSGDLINVGYTAGSGAGFKDATFFKINAFGSFILGVTFGGSENEIFKSIEIGANGNFLFAGKTNTFGNGQEDLLLVRADTIAPGLDSTIVIFQDLIPLNIQKNKIAPGISIFPNPSSSIVHVNIDKFNDNMSTKLYIFDVVGREILSKEIRNKETKIDVSKLDTGTYFIRIVVNQGEQVWLKKLIVGGDK